MPKYKVVSSKLDGIQTFKADDKYVSIGETIELSESGAQQLSVVAEIEQVSSEVNELNNSKDYDPGDDKIKYSYNDTKNQSSQEYDK